MSTLHEVGCPKEADPRNETCDCARLRSQPEIVTFGEGGYAASGLGAVKVLHAIMLKVALAAYARSKMQVNSMYTPANMLRGAGSITGKTYKRGQYQQAVTDLAAWIEANRVPVRRVSR